MNSDENKIDCVQNMEQLFQNLILKIKGEPSSVLNSRDHPMVGFYSTEVSEDSRVVVCSPDLPINITKYHKASSEMTATTAIPGQPGTIGKRREPVTTTSTEESFSPNSHNKRKMISNEEAYSSNLIGQKRKELPKLMTLGDSYPSSGSQVKRRIMSIEEAYSSQPGAPNNHQDLLKMVSMEEAYSQDLSTQNAQLGLPGAPAKRKELQTTMSTEDPYQCNICSKTFAVPARLTRHYRTHTGEKPFQCEYCAKSFSVKENLSVHRRIHTKERPYKCEVCARAFEHSGKLHRHMRIHTGERPHKCAVCAKTFIQSGQLVIHMRTHTGEKPYVCGACGKGFTCSKQLKVHSRTHTGEKPYACDICGKSFGYNHVLKLHQVAHYGEKVYKCTICNDTFTSKKCMEAHIKSHSDNPAVASSMSTPMSVVSSPSDSAPTIRSPGPMSVSSVSSMSSGSASDKENTSVEDRVEERYYGDYLAHAHYGHQSGVDLLAAAAVASNLSSLDPTLNITSAEEVLSLISSRKHSQNTAQSMQNTIHPSVQSVHSSHNRQVLNHFPVVERTSSPQYTTNYPQDHEIRKRVETILASKTTSSPHFVSLSQESDIRKRVEAVLATSYTHNLQNLSDLSRNLPSLQVQRVPTEMKDLDHGTDIRKRVEAALASTIDSQTLLVITPPSSTSVSPASSPEPSDTKYEPSQSIVINSPRYELSLPPRKRSKMILKSMQMEPNVRYSSVIHYAKAV